VLRSQVTSDPANATAAAAYIARRLDALADETERGWAGQFNEHGFQFERTLRGVKEIAVIDQPLLGSADARKLDEFAPSLQAIYPRPTPPAVLQRKDEETPIHGPVGLFEAVISAGRKSVALQREKGLQL
jgi:DNA gyrase subunit B